LGEGAGGVSLKDPKYYFGVRVMKDEKLSVTYVNADLLEIRDGCAIFSCDDSVITLVFAPYRWHEVFAASCFDGRPVALDNPEGRPLP